MKGFQLKSHEYQQNAKCDIGNVSQKFLNDDRDLPIMFDFDYNTSWLLLKNVPIIKFYLPALLQHDNKIHLNVQLQSPQKVHLCRQNLFLGYIR